jgi:hypothetical protein
MPDRLQSTFGSAHDDQEDGQMHEEAARSVGRDVRRWTGMAGLLWVVLQVASVLLFLTAGGPPPFSDTRGFATWIHANSGVLIGDGSLTVVATLVLLTAFAGLRSIIRSAGEAWEGAAALFLAAGTVTAATLIVAAAGEAAAGVVSSAGVDPATVLAVYATSQLVLTFVYFSAALVLGIGGYAAAQARILPRWVAWLSGVCVGLDLLAGLTVFGGAGNYGAFSLMSLILGSSPVFVWLLAVSVVLVRGSRSSRDRWQAF